MRRLDPGCGQCDFQRIGSRGGDPGTAGRGGGGSRQPVSVQRSVTNLRVRYAETDKMGVVYYANYLVWFEVGRTDLLRESGGSYRQLENEGVGLPVIEAHCEYKQSARYDDEIEVRTTGTMLSPVRVEFTYQIVRPSADPTLATGRAVHPALDSTGRPSRLPERVRGLFA